MWLSSFIKSEKDKIIISFKIKHIGTHVLGGTLPTQENNWLSYPCCGWMFNWFICVSAVTWYLCKFKLPRIQAALACNNTGNEI